MSKIAVVVLADIESHSDLARLVNALELAKECKEAGDDFELIFDGAGTKWLPELQDEDHEVHDLYESVSRDVTGACSFCAEAFGVKSEVKDAGVSLMEEFDDHPSLKSLVDEGYEIVTF